MHRLRYATLFVAFATAPPLPSAGASVDTAAALVAAVRDGAEGATIEIAAGTFEFAAPRKGLSHLKS